MNKMKIIGIVLLVIGITSFFLFENDIIGLLAGLCFGIGIGLFFTKPKKVNEETS